MQCLTGLSRRTRRTTKPNPASRPIVPRTLLPKAPSSNDQVFRISVIADSNETGVVSPASSAGRSLSQSFLSTASGYNTPTNSPTNTPAKPTVITMAPTEIRKRRIVPTPVPVTVPCGMLKLLWNSIRVLLLQIYNMYTVSQKTTLMLHTIDSTHINRFR